MNWTSALSYCREKYLDLANIRNETDKGALVGLDNQRTWIGLHNRWRWIDGSIFTLRHDTIKNSQTGVNLDHKCVLLNESLETLVFGNCSDIKPFYCHRGQ